jgi:hypothetical protein
MGLFDLSVQKRCARKNSHSEAVYFQGKTQSYALLNMALERYAKHKAKRSNSDSIKLSYSEITETLSNPAHCSRKPNWVGRTRPRRALEGLIKNIRAKIDLTEEEIYPEGSEESCFIIFQRVKSS